MSTILAVAAGGAVGAMARYLTVLQVTRWFGIAFPYGTLAVNVIGSFVLGLIVEVLTRRFGIDGGVRSFFVIGVMGAYTTFSSYSLDAVALLERYEYAPAAYYILANVLLSITALFFGLSISRAILD
jgi:CrcB protein